MILHFFCAWDPIHISTHQVMIWLLTKYLLREYTVTKTQNLNWSMGLSNYLSSTSLSFTLLFYPIPIFYNLPSFSNMKLSFGQHRFQKLKVISLPPYSQVARASFSLLSIYKYLSDWKLGLYFSHFTQKCGLYLLIIFLYICSQNGFCSVPF